MFLLKRSPSRIGGISSKAPRAPLGSHRRRADGRRGARGARSFEPPSNGGGERSLSVGGRVDLPESEPMIRHCRGQDGQMESLQGCAGWRGALLKSWGFFGGRCGGAGIGDRLQHGVSASGLFCGLPEG